MLLRTKCGVKNTLFPPHMDSYPTLNLPPVRLRAARRGGCDYVWDEIRGAWLLLTPEEWVRRHVAAWLLGDMAVPATNIIEEYPVPLAGTNQRADIVVTGRGQRPVMIVECKAPEVAIGSVVLDQAVRYNSVVKAPYIMLTNGLLHYFYVTWDFSSYDRCSALPELSGLL